MSSFQMGMFSHTCRHFLANAEYQRVDGSFVRWADGLRQHLKDNYAHEEHLEPISEDTNLPPRWSLEPALTATSVSENENSSKHNPQGLANGTSSADLLSVTGSWPAKLSECKRMTPDSHWQDVRLISLDIPPRESQQLRCNPGDCLTIYPKNFPEDAQRLINLLNWNESADKPLDLCLCPSLPRGLNISSNCTLRDIILNNIDFNAIPRRSFLKSISYYTNNPDHKERLLEFTMTEYLDEYFDYATRPRRSIIEVLEEFTSVEIPPSRIFDIFPLIRGRDFSIANGGALLNHPTDPSSTRVQLLIALVKYRTILRKPREGLCSRYISSIPLNTSIRVTHKPVLSPIHGQNNAARPLVAMATGTGVAPVRSLVHERLTHPSCAPMTIFFGNRNLAADYFFQDEWQELQKQGKLEIVTAFSRDQREKIYVQDLVRRDTSRVERTILDNGMFMVCGGSSKMADACKTAVFDRFLQKGGEEEKAKMLSAATWWQEIW